MIRAERHSGGDRPAPLSPSVVVWNTVVPALGLALMLGVSMLPAFVVAAVAAIAIHAALGARGRMGAARLARASGY